MHRLDDVERRNFKVSGDKAWEVSVTRRLLIAAFTYVSILVYGFAIGVRYPAINALIPAAGYLLSTLTFPAVKRRWLARRLKKSI